MSNPKELSVCASLIYKDYSEITLSLPRELTLGMTCRCEYCTLRVGGRELLHAACVPLEALCASALVCARVHSCTGNIPTSPRLHVEHVWRVYVSHGMHYGFICFFEQMRELSLRMTRHMDTWYLLYCREIKTRRRRLPCQK